MKLRLLLFLSVILFTVNANGQAYFPEIFEPPFDYYRSLFQVDTINFHHNLWQIGRPNKSVFVSAQSRPNAMVTDTLNTYPANDTSVFYLKQRVPWLPSFYVAIYFKFMLDIDTGATVRLDISGDTGRHWFNPLTEDSVYAIFWRYPKPRLDTSSGGIWTDFSMDLSVWSRAFPGGTDTFPSYLTADSLFYRFTFISGSDTSVHKDGWMVDDFYCSTGGTEGIASAENEPNCLALYPNPASHHFFVSGLNSLTGSVKMDVVDRSGAVVAQFRPAPFQQQFFIDVPPGLYSVRITDDKGTYLKRLTVMQ